MQAHLGDYITIFKNVKLHELKVSKIKHKALLNWLIGGGHGSRSGVTGNRERERFVEQSLREVSSGPPWGTLSQKRLEFTDSLHRMLGM